MKTKSLSIILFLIILTSCGPVEIKDSNHEASGEVTVKVDWGLDQFDEAFREECQQKYDNGEIDNVEQCVSDKITDLINLVNSGLDNQGE